MAELDWASAQGLAQNEPNLVWAVIEFQQNSKASPLFKS